MYLQTLSSANLNPNSNSYSSFSNFFVPFIQRDPYVHLVPTSDFKRGFCSVAKRVSRSPTMLRNHGSFVGIVCASSGEKDDGFYTRRCVEIARKAIGCTSPNPMVGCVIVKDGKIVGEGFHPKAGQPHAEVFALREAGDFAENATAYVSLEPCNHYGRTPPCTEALIQAKVKRVIVGMVDPNPIVASKGVEKLRSEGIEVTVGVEEELCKKLNEAYIHRMLTRKPFVTLRYSLSVNGRLSNLLGEGAKESGGYYSQLLQEYDGIIISSASLTENSTFPTSQEPQAKQPLQIIISRPSSAPVRLPPLTAEAASQVIIFTEENAVVDPEIAQQGIETVMFDKLHLDTILDYCGKRGMCSILLDIQGNYVDLEDLLDEGIQQGLFQKVVMEVLPFWDNGAETDIGISKILEEKVIRLKQLIPTTLKKSIVVDGYF